MLVHVTTKLKQPVSELLFADGQIIARVTSAPENNKANTEIITLLAKHYGVHKTSIVLIRGAKSKQKTFELTTK